MSPVDKSSPISDSQNSGNSDIYVSRNDEVETKGSGSQSELAMQEVSGSMSRLSLNPLAQAFIPASHRSNQTVVLAQEFIPASHRSNQTVAPAQEFIPASHRSNQTVAPAQEFITASHRSNQTVANGFSRRRSNDNQGRQPLSGRACREQREDSIKRTVYVSDVDLEVSEEELASLFIGRCGRVVDCRICGHPKSLLRFGFVEFGNIYGARAALQLSGTIVGLYPIRVSPSKTAIQPVNPDYLPKSEEEIALVARTIYCMNIDSMVAEADVWVFFEQYCGQVTRLRLLGDPMQSSRRAFVEFAFTDSAVAALNLSGSMLGALQIRVSPSKTPIRDPRLGLE